MSEELETTTLTKDYSLKLPKLNDKTIYFARVDENGTVTEKSYAVSSSFKGILRMSPNDYDLLSDNISATYDLTYSDSNDMYLTGGVIQVSDSDGYLIDLKLSQKSIEIDNTYVRGMAQSDDLVLLAQYNKQAFTINGINYLPVAYNDDYSTSTGEWFCSYDCNVINTTTPIITSDDIDASNESEEEDDELLTSDKSAIVVSKSVGDTRTFDYKNTRSLVRDVILDSLLSLQTVPTGSIHFVPVNIDQYQALMKSDDDASGSEPNRPGYNRYTTLGNEMTNTLIRDYLPCDGRRYFCRDFPELAKLLKDEYIMYGEKGTYIIGDEEDSDIGTYVFGGGDNIIRQRERFNDYSGMTDENFLKNGLVNVDDKESDESANEDVSTANERRTFRVPDLRHKFIKSAWLSKTIASGGAFSTGLYTPDHLADETDDVHSHFIADAIHNTSLNVGVDYQDHINPTATIGNLKSTSYHALLNVYNEGTDSLAEQPAILSLCSNPTTYAESNSNDCWKGCEPPDSTGTRRRWRYPVRMGNYFWSVAPNDEYYGTPESDISKGLSSSDIPSFENTDVFSINDVYKIENNEQRGYYGYDNCPEFVACLPLIKI